MQERAKSLQLAALTAVITLIAIIALFLLLKNDPTTEFILMEPGLDGKELSGSESASYTQIGQYHDLFEIDSIEGFETWSSFRGDYRDAKYYSYTRLISNFPENYSPLWEIELGEGHAGAVIYEGYVYILDYDENQKRDKLRAYSLATGEELWSLGYRLDIKRNHGFSRTVPAVYDKYVVSIGPMGHVMCADRFTGEYMWGVDLVDQFESLIPGWYGAQCPLIDDGVVVVAPAATTLLAGYDLESGELLWESFYDGEISLSHSSIIKAEIDNHKQYIYAGIGKLVGISAEDETIGELLWDIPFNANVVAPTPIYLENGEVFITAGYGAGSMFFRVDNINGQWVTTQTIKYTPRDGFASEQQTPIFLNDKLYGVLPKDAGGLREQFVSSDLEGNITNTIDGEYKFGLGPYIYADDKFYVLDDKGILRIIVEENDQLKVIDEAHILKGVDAWAPIAIADGKMLLRDSVNMICLDISERGNR